MNKSFYKGTKKNFHHYIGPRLRNLIPPLTRKHKLKIGCCEHCGNINVELDAAHKHEINRRKIIDDECHRSQFGKTHEEIRKFFR